MIVCGAPNFRIVALKDRGCPAENTSDHRGIHGDFVADRTHCCLVGRLRADIQNITRRGYHAKHSAQSPVLRLVQGIVKELCSTGKVKALFIRGGGVFKI